MAYIRNTGRTDFKVHHFQMDYILFTLTYFVAKHLYKICFAFRVRGEVDNRFAQTILQNQQLKLKETKLY